MRPSWNNIALDPESIQVQDVYVANLILRNSENSVRSVLKSLPVLTDPWIFVLRDTVIVGVIPTTLLSDTPPNDKQLQQLNVHSLAFTSLEEPLQDALNKLSSNRPVAIVNNEFGNPIGYIDQRSSESALHRARLSNKSRRSLMSLPWVSEISKVSSDLGIPVYLIGGCVRDWILNRNNVDLDFAVEGDAIALAHTLVQEFGGHVDEFSSFGGAHWKINQMTLDFTMCRQEIYPTFGSLPEVFPSHISEDLQRRDFTTNAMAISLFKPTLGLLIDPFDGRSDLESKRIQILHKLSWHQDPTRIFRACRYTSRFDFTLEHESKTLLHKCLTVITPGEELTFSRIGIELSKLLDEPDINSCFERLRSWGVISSWFPFWDNIQFPQSCELSYNVSPDEFKDVWWMIMVLSIPKELRIQYASMIGIRANAVKSTSILERDIPDILQGLSTINTQNSDVHVQVGTLLQQSTSLHWMILIHLNPDISFLIEWWVSTGRHRPRRTTGQDILRMGIPKGPYIGVLLQTAQSVAWQGGDQNSEVVEIKKIWKKLNQDSHDE